MSHKLLVIEREANRLIEKYLGGQGWKFAWNNRKRAFGLCSYRKKEIQLSIFLSETEPFDSVCDTILHEIAHALTPGAGHGPAWKAVARRIGLSDPKSGKQAAVQPKYSWVLEYEGEFVSGYHRKPHKVAKNIQSYQVKGKPESLGKLVLKKVA